ncbi:AI-2E family transporter [Corynebacterium caspium]|uniref:AI-2E family transporter n=1 Tax=Corynebacterium caspium TaxID=234828 RepID=UPI000361EAD2|nr:AI-2E family transporter [Corynebacterium caspium]WKD58631.1 pheromone autoinducer 2 transporter [Corynebacterium caspium DSM 44850]
MSTKPEQPQPEESIEGFSAAVEEAAGLDAPEADKGVVDRSVILAADGAVIAKWALRFIIVVIASWIIFKGLGIVWKGVLPIILALLFSTVLSPIVAILRGIKIPPTVAALIALIGSLGIVGGIMSLIAPSISDQIPELAKQSRVGVNRLFEWVQGPPLEVDLGEVQGEIDKLMNSVTQFLQEHSQSIAGGVVGGVSAATSFITTALITFVLIFFFLKDGPKFLPWLRTYVGDAFGWHLTEVLTRTWITLAGFIRAQAIVSFVDAFFIGLGLVFLNVPMALALAVITFFAGFIPIIGAISAGALAVIIALVTNGLTNAGLVLLVIVAVQQLESNILSPLLQSKAMNLHAAIVLLSVTIGAGLFGIIGAFLAVPVAATLAVWIRYHAEMVSLRSGQTTIDDIEIATQEAAPPNPREAAAAMLEKSKTLVAKVMPGGDAG